MEDNLNLMAVQKNIHKHIMSLSILRIAYHTFRRIAFIVILFVNNSKLSEICPKMFIIYYYYLRNLCSLNEKMKIKNVSVLNVILQNL